MIDKLLLLSGEPIVICEGLTLYQPTLGDIRDYGESRFYGTFWTLCAAPWDMPSALDDVGINFMKITEWELFTSTILAMDVEHTKLIFGDLDFTKFQVMKRTQKDGTEDLVLYNGELLIDEDLYRQFIQYVKAMIGFEHSGKKAGNEVTRRTLIELDRKQRRRDAKKAHESVLFNGIISLVNTEEFKYNYKTIFEITLFQFTKSLVQIQGKKAACALLQGSMSGFCDTSKIPQRDFQWMYSEDKYNKPRGKKLFKGDPKAIQSAGAVK